MDYSNDAYGSMGFDLDTPMEMHLGETVTPRRAMARQAIIANSGSPQVQLRGFNPIREELSVRDELAAMAPSTSAVDAKIRENQLLSDFYEAKVLPKFAAMKTRLAERDNHIASLKEWRAETEKSMAFQETELKNLRAQLATVRVQLGEANTRIDTQTAMHLDVSRQLEVSQARVHELEGLLEAEQDKVEDLKHQLQVQQGFAVSQMSQARQQELERGYAAGKVAEARACDLERELAEALDGLRELRARPELTFTGLRTRSPLRPRSPPVDVLGGAKEPSTTDSRFLSAEIEALEGLRERQGRPDPTLTGVRARSPPRPRSPPVDVLGGAKEPSTRDSRYLGAEIEAARQTVQSLKQQLERGGPNGGSAKPITLETALREGNVAAYMQQQQAGSAPLSPGRSRAGAPYSQQQHSTWEHKPSYQAPQPAPYQGHHSQHQHRADEYSRNHQPSHQPYASHQGTDYRLGDPKEFSHFANFIAALPGHEAMPVRDRQPPYMNMNGAHMGTHRQPYSAPQTPARGYGAPTFSEPSHTPHRPFSQSYSQAETMRPSSPLSSRLSQFGSPRQQPYAPPVPPPLPYAPAAPQARASESRFRQFLPVENQRLYQAPFPRSNLDQQASRPLGREFMMEC